MPSYVLVWENNTLGHSRVSGKTWPGHASLNIGPLFFDKDMALGELSYVSFWPKDGAKFSAVGAVLTPSQKGEPVMTFDKDVSNEGYLPDHVVEIPSTEESEQKMKAEWKATLLKKGGAEYKTLRNNCSTIVSRVLHAGGFYAQRWPVDNNLVWSPADVRRLAWEINGGKNVSWSGFLDVLKKSGIDKDDLQNKFGVCDYARSGCYCTTGAKVKYQTGEKYKDDYK